MSDGDDRIPIVGIGASAGGIEALEALFRAMPEDVGAGFVIVTHLSPERESLLPGIIQRFTKLPVEGIEDGVKVTANRIYVMPENAHLTIEGGRLRLTRPRPPHRQAHPVDLFLCSLAMDRGESAVGIILSGNDDDGTLGAKAIKERGGLTMAQVGDGSAPKYTGMPQTAIASGMVDFAIPAHDMPNQLVHFARALSQSDGSDGSDDVTSQVDDRRPEIYRLLREQTGHDFSGYKTRTFNRRIHRRMQLLQHDDVEAYVEVLRRQASEVAALFRDLLIGVTTFFRDADAFEALERTVIPRLFEGKERSDSVRVWIPGCATGEEVYSIAMLIREHMDGLGARPNVQIFATDIDQRSLDLARAARFAESQLENLSPERRRRFFVQENAAFVLEKEIRDLCTFSPHSLVRDPPFSRMDLVSCRNLLIYLATSLQEQIIPLLHYSLRPSGYLFLGTSENVGPFSDLFAPVDKKKRIFKAKPKVTTGLRLPTFFPRRSPLDFASDAGRTPKGVTIQAMRECIEARVVDRFAPAHVVVNAEGDIVFYSNRTGRYLEAPSGAPSRQLAGLARKGIRLELRGALRQALSDRGRVERHNLLVEMDGGRMQVVSVVIEPLDDDTEPTFFLVLFIDEGPSVEPNQVGVARPGREDDDSAVAALERELYDTRERLQSMIEEYETALEELKSSNEELVSVNEELQSTNEELEASKEELQSLNEEMQTVNLELGHKIEELDQSNGDLRNLLESSKIATIFLGRDLAIRNFTPLAAEIFNLVPSDRGRSLAIFASRLVYPEFNADLARTIDEGEMIDTRVAHDDGRRRYLVRMQPYVDSQGDREGATITFVDVTDLPS